MHRWACDPRSAHLWNNARAIPTLEQFGYELEQRAATNKLLLIASKQTGQFVGFVETYSANPTDGHVSLLVFLPPTRRNLGIGAEACFLMMNYLFVHQPYRKIYADAYEYNSASISLIQNAGFMLDGRLRHHVWYDDRYWDLLKFAFYREQFPQLRSRLSGLLVGTSC